MKYAILVLVGIGLALVANSIAFPSNAIDTSLVINPNVTRYISYYNGTDTNASTACAAGEFLNGDGTCDAGYLDADGTDDDTPDSDAEVPNDITLDTTKDINGTESIAIDDAYVTNGTTQWHIWVNSSGYLIMEVV